MRLWHFIFLSNWSSDRQPTGETLFELGRRATRHKRPLSLLVYPEGTLVSALTRPKSAAYAEKLGVVSGRDPGAIACCHWLTAPPQPDMKNQLLPRSTGLLFSLRTLALNVPDLVLYDLTVGYPGLPAAAYAQTYYSLQSIYTAHQGPPTVHIHLRQYDLANVPIGTVPQLPSVGGGVKQEGYVSPVELDERLTAEERKTFDEWVRARWTEKDLLLDQFYESGEFPCRDGQRKEIRFELRGFDDYVSRPVGSGSMPGDALTLIFGACFSRPAPHRSDVNGVQLRRRVGHVQDDQVQLQVRAILVRLGDGQGALNRVVT